MADRIVVLTKERHFDFVRSVLPSAELTADYPVAGKAHFETLLIFGSGIIIRDPQLTLFDVAVNFHAASPDYPGRDPHHWACYEGATRYGATAHHIDKAVDSGPIIGTIISGVSPFWGPRDYFEHGEKCARALFAILAPLVCSLGVTENGEQWRGKAKTRKDTIAMCNLRDVRDQKEIEHRRKSFTGFEAHFKD